MNFSVIFFCLPVPVFPYMVLVMFGLALELICSLVIIS